MNRLARASLASVVGLTLLNGRPLFAQVATRESNAEARTRAIAAAFSKSKRVMKERHGITLAKYKEVRSEPVVRANPQTLSGTYEVEDFGFVLSLRVDSGGGVTGSGREMIGDGFARTFTLSNAVVRGALLTGMKVFTNGRAEGIEGVFLNRTSYDSQADPGHSQFGLGVMGSPVEIHGITVEKLFYRLKP